MKRFLLLLLGVTTLSVALVACGGKDDDKATTAGTTLVESDTSDVAAQPETTTAETTTQETTTEAPTTAAVGNEETTKSEYETLSMAEIEGLTNEFLPWGSGGEVDSDNVPVGCTMYENLYSKYNCDFVRTDENKDKIIYLTMDEGYENGCTPAILDTLKEKDVKIVFFCTMPFVKENPDLVQRMIDEGHIVGSHSVTHPAGGLPQYSLEEQQGEMDELKQYIKENFNYELKLFRYPEGVFSEQSAALMQRLGYTSVFWSFAYKDYDTANQPDEAEALQKTIDGLCPGAIYLLHAVSQTNTNILADFIDQTRAQGYTFERYY